MATRLPIKMTLPIMVVGAVLLLATRPVWAHHAMFAQFDVKKSITLKGTLTKMDWVNPHGWIYMDVKRADGRVETWTIETGNPLRMANRGLSPADFRPGIEIIVGGFPAKDGKRTLAGWIITFPDREASTPDREASFALGR